MNIRVYLDHCCFNRPYDSQDQLAVRLEAEAKLFVQGEIIAGRLDLVWSFMMDYENSFNPFKGRREAIGEWRSFAREVMRLNASVESRTLQVAWPEKQGRHPPRLRRRGRVRLFPYDGRRHTAETVANH